MVTEKISTTALAKMRGVDTKQLFEDLKKAGYISRVGDEWILTELGSRFGGDYIDHPKFGQFIVWPVNLHVELTTAQGQLFSATQLGEKLGLAAKKINLLLSELGWITRQGEDWLATQSGVLVGAMQKVDKPRGRSYVLWHDSILHNKHLRRTVDDFLGHDVERNTTDHSYAGFRQKFAAKYRALDGHYLRSKGELMIDNWLYAAGVVHAYQRRLPIEEVVVSDFYLPGGKVYIQFWGTDEGEVALDRREFSRSVFAQHQFNLIEVEQDEVDKLDDVLPERLRAFGIKAY